MHGIYPHNDTFTLSRGTREDKVQIQLTPHGFIIERVAQQGVNVDWAEVAIETSFTWSRADTDPLPACRRSGRADGS